MNNLEIQIFYHIKKDLLSDDRVRGQFRKLLCVNPTIHLFLHNIWKDSDNEVDFITKLMMIYLCELMCGFTYESKLECEKCPRMATNGVFLLCPFLEFLKNEYNVEYIFNNRMNDKE